LSKTWKTTQEVGDGTTREQKQYQIKSQGTGGGGRKKRRIKEQKVGRQKTILKAITRKIWGMDKKKREKKGEVQAGGQESIRKSATITDKNRAELPKNDRWVL